MTLSKLNLIGVDALETIRTYGARVRALPLHLHRLSCSLDALREARNLPVFNQKRHVMIHREVKLEIERYGLTEDNVSPFLESHHDQAHTVIRCTVSLEGAVRVVFSALDTSYVGRPRSVATCALPIDCALPRHAKHNVRSDWVEGAHRLKADELLLCGEATRREESPLFEAHNSNIWLMQCDPTRERSLTDWLKCTLYQSDDQLRRCDLGIEQRPLRDTRWYTPPLDGQCLPGVTRALLINILKLAGAEVHADESVSQMMTLGSLERSTPQDVYYLSSTLKSVSPISAINQVIQQRPPFDADLCLWLDHCLRYR